MKFEVSMSIMTQMLRYASAKGVDTSGILRAEGIDASEAGAPDARIAIDAYNRIQDHLAKITSDADFGLHMGEYALPASWNIVGYLMMNCNTLAEALDKSLEYHKILGNMIRIERREDPCEAVLKILPQKGSYGHSIHCYHATMSSTVRIIKALVGEGFSLTRAGFGHKTPGEIQAYDRIFNCELLFDSPGYFLSFKRESLDLPVIQSSPEMLAILEQHAGRYLTGLKNQHPVTERVSRLIVEKMQGADLGIDAVAAKLAMSVRSLQDKLRAEGTTYSEILRDIRKTLSKQYLGESPYSVSEIAYMMGFSEPAAFIRSFKRWTGTTPGAFRKSCGPGSIP